MSAECKTWYFTKIIIVTFSFPDAYLLLTRSENCSSTVKQRYKAWPFFRISPLLQYIPLFTGKIDLYLTALKQARQFIDACGTKIPFIEFVYIYGPIFSFCPCGQKNFRLPYINQNLTQRLLWWMNIIIKWNPKF